MPDGLQTHQHPKSHDRMNQFIRITVYFSPLPAPLGVCVCVAGQLCMCTYIVLALFLWRTPRQCYSHIFLLGCPKPHSNS